MDREFQVFISYTRADQQIAEDIYILLENHGLNPWLDKKKIKGGQNWDFELRQALDHSSIILLIWSNSSRGHRGYVQREVKLALAKLEEKLVDDIFLVPVIIGEETDIPPQIKDIHCLSHSDADIETQILDSIRHQMKRLGGKIEERQESEQIFWKPVNITEKWEGLPGYQVQVSSFEFSSPKYKNISDISHYVNAQFLSEIFEHRQQKFDQEPDHFNYAQDEWGRTNTFDASCAEPEICGTMMSLLFTKSWYFAGAAHPNHAHETFNFLIEPCTQITNLSQLFEAPDDVFSTIQSLVRQNLMEQSVFRGGEEDADEELDATARSWIEEGTKSWDDLSSFVVTEQGIEVFFDSYQVAPYAAGLPHAEIEFKDIHDDIKRHLRTALSIDYSRFD